MARTKISKTLVELLTCPAGEDRVFLWDGYLSGFGVMALPSGNKSYVAQYRQNGKSHRVTIGKHGRLTPDEARSKAKKILGNAESGVDLVAQRRAARGVRTFDQLANEFMAQHMAAKRKPRSHKSYASLLKNHIIPKLGTKRLTEVTKSDVSKLHGSMKDTPGAANRALAVISSAWNWAAVHDEIDKNQNPAAGIERYPEHSKERFLSDAELTKLGETLRTAETTGLPWQADLDGPNAKHIPKKKQSTVVEPYAIAAIRLLLLTGARLGEILSAKWSYFDEQRGLLLLPDSKTGKKPIYLAAAAIAVLAAIPRLDGNPYIIPGTGLSRRAKKKTSSSHTVRPRTDLNKPWKSISTAAGLDGVRLHDLRHSFASTGASASLGLQMIGKLLGHAHTTTTARYAHLADDPAKRANELISGHIAAALSGAAKKPTGSLATSRTD